MKVDLDDRQKMLPSTKFKLFLLSLLFVNVPVVIGREAISLNSKTDSDGNVRRFHIPAMKKMEASSPGRVEILEAGSFGSRPPSLLRTENSVVSSVSRKQSRDNSESESEEDESEEMQIGSQNYVIMQPPSISQPTYSGQRPIGPPITGGGGGFTIRPYNNKPSPIATTQRPTVLPLPPSPPTVILTTTTSTIIGPPTTNPPVTSGTIVPIIGGGGGGGDGEDELPPSPPEETVSPPSPPDQAVRSNVFSSRTLATSRSGPSIPKARNVALPSPKLKLRDKLRDSNLNTKVKLEQDIMDANIITDFVFSDIKCFKTRAKEYFGATIHLKSGFQLPYIRDRPQDPLTSNNCRMEKAEGQNAFHMSVTDLKGCGVESCGESMCLTMVFPRVPLLALAEDEVTTIKCIPQKNTMTETKTISFAGDTLSSDESDYHNDSNDSVTLLQTRSQIRDSETQASNERLILGKYSRENRRSSSTVEGGYQEFAAEVGIFRQNPGTNNGLYVKRVNSGGVVQLGEPLQLRSVVRGGDGWIHSKLADVKVWRMRDNYSHNLDNLDPNDASEVITLVDGQGCRNNEYTVIADSHPLKDPRNELVHHFTFKAFLFRGQRANEPLIVTAKVQACQERIDCIPSECLVSTSRFKRSPTPKEINNSSAIIHDWSSKMALRVVGMKDHPSSLTEEDFPFDFPANVSKYSSEVQNQMNCAEKMAISGFGGALISLLLCGLIFGLYSFVIRGRRSVVDKQGSFQTPFTVALPPPQHQPSGNQRNDTNNNKENRNNETIRKQTYHGDTIRKVDGKPPLPLPNSKEGSEKRNDSELSNVAKVLHELTKNNSESKTESSEYEIIGEDGGDNISTSESETTDSKKRGGVYIVYCCNDKKKRPTSLPPSLRGKKGRLMSAHGEDDISFESSESIEESDDLYGKSGSRRTVRSVKRGHTHRNRSSGAPTLRRRLSAFYRENVKNPSVSKGCSFPSRHKKPSIRHVTFGRGNQRRPTFDYSEGIYSSAQLSSDIDSAYYGSVASGGASTKMSDESSAYCLKEDVRGKGDYPRVSPHGQTFHHFREQAASMKGNTDNFPFQHIQGNSTLSRNMHSAMQQQPQSLVNARKSSLFGTTNLGGDNGASSLPPLGQTTATHFVTRNDSSTQIIIVPETHV